MLLGRDWIVACLLSRRLEGAMRTVLFHRGARYFRGADLKLWDYFNHVRTSPGFKAQIYLSQERAWTSRNPWLLGQEERLRSWNRVEGDAIFLSGFTDWQMLDP